jgi:hypothetical protein
MGYGKTHECAFKKAKNPLDSDESFFMGDEYVERPNSHQMYGPVSVKYWRPLPSPTYK